MSDLERFIEYQFGPVAKFVEKKMKEASPTPIRKQEAMSIFDREAQDEMAKIFYKLFAYAGAGEKPAWVPNGNSLRQDEARNLARQVSDAAEANLRERGRLRDRLAWGDEEWWVHDSNAEKCWDNFTVAIIRIDQEQKP